MKYSIYIKFNIDRNLHNDFNLHLNRRGKKFILKTKNIISDRHNILFRCDRQPLISNIIYYKYTIISAKQNIITY